MSTQSGTPDGWAEVERPRALHRRFEFAAYPEARAFLARLEALSKETGLYPDLSFGRTHVNVTVHGTDGADLNAAAREYASRADALSPAGVSAR